MSDTLAIFRDLDRQSRATGDYFVVEGELAIARLLESRFRVESIVCTPTARRRLAIPAGVELHELAPATLRELVGFDFHRGALACARRPVGWELPEDLISRRRATLVVAEAIADPSNLGALVRNARAFGVDAVIIDAHGADPLSRKAIRASMGNVFRVPLVVESFSATDQLGHHFPTGREPWLARLRSLGWTLVAATPHPSAADLHHFVRPDKIAVLVGNEGGGLSNALLRLADCHVRIPIAFEADSLNVAAATAVLLDRLR